MRIPGFPILFLMTVSIVLSFVTFRYDVSRWLLGTQVDFLPSLIVYISLRRPFWEMTVLVVGIALLVDSLSASRLGVSLIPAFVVAYLLFQRRGDLLKNETFTQFVVGGLVAGVMPMFQLMMIHLFMPLENGRPTIHVGVVWSLIGLVTMGAVCTPLLFTLFDRWLGVLPDVKPYRPLAENTREIVRRRRK